MKPGISPPKAPPAPPKVTNTVAQGSTKPQPQVTNSPPATPAVTRPATPDKTPQGDAFKTSSRPPTPSSSRPNIDAHQLQGPQVQAPQLSESEIADLALGRTPGKGKPAPVSPAIQKVCEQMKAEVPGADVLRYTDQGNHPMLKQSNMPSGTDAGVCSAMTSEWIRTGIDAGGDPKKGSEAFGKVSDNHFDKFIGKQHQESLTSAALSNENKANLTGGAKLEADLAKLQEKKAQRGHITEQLTNPDLTPDQRASLKDQRKQLTQELGAGVAQLKQDSAALEANQLAMQPKVEAFRTQRGGGNPGVHVQDFQPIQGDFTQKLYDSTQQNGHYRIGLRKDGDAAEGHVLGLQKTDGGGRLLDANTAEWKTGNHKDTVNLTAEHIERLYPNYASFDITRYN
jgi:hypothetical protein